MTHQAMILYKSCLDFSGLYRVKVIMFQNGLIIPNLLGFQMKIFQVGRLQSDPPGPSQYVVIINTHGVRHSAYFVFRAPMLAL